MFNFNQNKNKFDFNQIYENSLYHFSLDDFDDDEDIQVQTHTKIKDILNFDTFLLSNVFNAIGITSKLGTENSKTEPVRYAWKKVQQEDGEHYVAYIFINQSKKDFHLYIDLNNTTKELYIGNCNSYKNSKYFTISYPLIKICEAYNYGPVYISDIYVDLPFGYIETPEDTLKKIELPHTYTKLTQNISFYYCVWNNKKYYYPYNGLSKKNLTEIDNNVKISHTFVEHFNGCKNKISNAVSLNLYYGAFDSWNDFCKIATIFCSNGATVKTDFNYKFTPENYQEELEKFKNFMVETTGIIEENKKKQLINEEKNKLKIQNLLPEKILEHFDSINKKAPNTLSTRLLYKERKSNDPYRKFDLPVIELILKDNGIDVDQIVEKSEKVFEDTLYKFINMIDSHFDNIDCIAANKDLLFYDIFNDIKLVPTYTTNKNENKLFDGLTKEEVNLTKNLISQLKVFPGKNDRELNIDINRLNNKSEDTQKLAIAIILHFCKYNKNNIYPLIDKLYTSNLNEINHIYNKFMILQRFVYLLGILAVDDHNNGSSDSIWEYPNQSGLYDYRYTHIESNYYDTYNPLSVGDNWIKLNTYTQLYKFLKMIALVIDNGYNITIHNLSCVNERTNRLLEYYNIGFKQEDIDNEFNYSNKPNIDLLNMASINKMLLTIFTNIDKKI